MAPQGVVVLGVSVDKNEKLYKQFLQRFQVDFKTARDPNADIPSEYGTFQFPDSYIIDPHGRVVEQIINAPISAYLPATADVPASVNQGVPLASRNPDHPLSHAVRQFVETRVPLGNRTAQYGASRP